MVLLSASFTYNSVGNISSIDESGQIGVGLTQFGYDDLQRLISAGTVSEPESYSYDAVGNRETSHLSALHTVNDADRLLEDDEFTYTYDANGNLETKTEKSSGLNTTYSYDAQDQLVSVLSADGTVITYAYDALGRRTAKTVAGTVTKYLYDGPDILVETDSANVVQARYFHGDRVDNPLAFERNGQEFYFHTDHQGSVRQVSDGSGAVVNQYNYDSYGQFTERVEIIPQPYGFTAREQDSESDLHFYRSRYYDPGTGRFTQEDKIGFDSGDANLYRYVSNRPNVFVDPYGFQAGDPSDPETTLGPLRRMTMVQRRLPLIEDAVTPIDNYILDELGFEDQIDERNITDFAFGSIGAAPIGALTDALGISADILRDSDSNSCADPSRNEQIAEAADAAADAFDLADALINVRRKADLRSTPETFRQRGFNQVDNNRSGEVDRTQLFPGGGAPNIRGDKEVVLRGRID